MNLLLKLFSPFKKLSSAEKWIGTLIILVLILSIWSMSGSKYIPTPMEIVKAFPRLLDGKDLVGNFLKSLGFCFKAIGYSIIIALTLCYMSVLPIFRTFCEFLRKFRFLPSAGLSFLFLKIGGGYVDNQMLYLMIWGVTTWLADSMIGIALSITDDEIMYARSLRLSRWQAMREVLIKGKAADIFNAIISNFAMAWLLLATIENIAKASGGIGVVLAESNKYYKFEEVYAIQVLILLTGIAIDYLLRTLRGLVLPYTSLKN